MQTRLRAEKKANFELWDEFVAQTVSEVKNELSLLKIPVQLVT